MRLPVSKCSRKGNNNAKKKKLKKNKKHDVFNSKYRPELEPIIPFTRLAISYMYNAASDNTERQMSNIDSSRILLTRRYF
uniref:Uncharacterized protein n=1 Tax=Glossina austeni TaxID=7395 RepID=A0A1A9VNA1_GLOAU